MKEDIVRVLRIIEYTGKRSQMELQIQNSMRDGTHTHNPHVTLRIATIGTYPEILEAAKDPA